MSRETRRSAAVNDSSSSIRGCGSAVLCAAALVLAAGKAHGLLIFLWQKHLRVVSKDRNTKAFARQKPSRVIVHLGSTTLRKQDRWSLIGSCISSFFCLTEKHSRLKASRVFANNTETDWHGCFQSSRWHSPSSDNPGSAICAQSGPKPAGHSSHLDWRKLWTFD